MTASRSRKSPKVTLQVSQEIIDKSMKRDSSHCMIAETIKQQIPGAKLISVDLATIRFSLDEPHERYIYLTPRPAQIALLDFDQGKSPAPFQMRLANAHVLKRRDRDSNVRKRTKATLTPAAPDSSTNATPPARRDGDPPPLGPLHSGTGSASASRTGRRREFGLRAMTR